MIPIEKPLTIDEYEFGSIRIGGSDHDGDVIIRGTDITRWWREKGHLLQAADIRSMVESSPEVIVVGTGYHGAVKIAEDALSLCREKGIELITRPTTEAVEIYNRLVEEEDRIVFAALHLTC